MRDSRTDVASISDHQKMTFVSPMAHSHRHKKQKCKIKKKQPDIPAISELNECLRTSKRDRDDLFDIYGKTRMTLFYSFSPVLFFYMYINGALK